NLRRSRRHVRGQGRRELLQLRTFRRAAAPLHARLARQHPQARSVERACPYHHRRRGAFAAGAAGGLSLRRPLRTRRAAVPPRRAPPGGDLRPRPPVGLPPATRGRGV
ncbi:uncharacterized protein METZ01_LOCUS448875, partial [marine metagenome]